MLGQYVDYGPQSSAISPAYIAGFLDYFHNELNVPTDLGLLWREHSIAHLGLVPEVRDNIIMKYYESGHMMYTHEPSLVQFKEDVANFVERTSGN